MTLAMRKGAMPGDEPRATHLFRRGDWLKPGKEVTFGTPAFLHPLPKDADGSRLAFAQWLTDKKSPTTARVAVNPPKMVVKVPNDGGSMPDMKMLVSVKKVR